MSAIGRYTFTGPRALSVPQAHFNFIMVLGWDFGVLDWDSGVLDWVFGVLDWVFGVLDWDFGVLG